MSVTLPLFTIDAFSSTPFAGNPAAICLDITKEGLADDLMQKIACEMNISETAFIKKIGQENTFEKSSHFGLRWFTPTTEVPLCGHATLASAAALFLCVGNSSEQLTFSTLSGDLYARLAGKFISLDLPLNMPIKIEDKTEIAQLLKVVVGDLKIKDIQISQKTRKLLVRLDDSLTVNDLEGLSPDPSAIIPAHNTGSIKGVIVTLKNDGSTGDADGRAYDFLSRYFAPWVGINEDPVTGSAHTVLAGYWSQQLGKSTLYARQCSRRGGDLQLTVQTNGHVEVAGPAAVVVKGSITV